MDIYDHIKKTLSEPVLNVTELLILSKKAIDYVNSVRGDCFTTFISELLLQRNDVFGIVQALCTIRPPKYISDYDYDIIRKLIDKIDDDKNIRSNITPKFWKRLQTIEPIHYRTCQFCCSPHPEYKCQNCKIAYCSKKCQTNDWSRHKPFCFQNSKESIYYPVAHGNGGVNPRLDELNRQTYLEEKKKEEQFYFH